MENIFFKKMFFCAVLINSLVMLGAEEEQSNRWQIIPGSPTRTSLSHLSWQVSSVGQRYLNGIDATEKTPLCRMLDTTVYDNKQQIVSGLSRAILNPKQRQIRCNYSENILSTEGTIAVYNNELRINTHKVQELVMQFCLTTERFETFYQIVEVLDLDALQQAVSLLRKFECDPLANKLCFIGSDMSEKIFKEFAEGIKKIYLDKVSRSMKLLFMLINSLKTQSFTEKENQTVEAYNEENSGCFGDFCTIL